MNKVSFIAVIFAAGVMLSCSGVNGHGDSAGSNGRNHKTGDVDSAAVDSADTLQSGWMQQTEVPSMGVTFSVTPEGGAKVVFNDWNKLAEFARNVQGVQVPTESLNECKINGLQGKVKGLCILGETPNEVYFLLENQNVQLFSIDKMMNQWDFYAGRLISKDSIKEMKIEVNETEDVVAVLNNGTQLSRKTWTVDAEDLWAYYVEAGDGNKNRFVHLHTDVDGSIIYSEGHTMQDQGDLYHGYITEFSKNDMGDAKSEHFAYKMVRRKSLGEEKIVKVVGSFDLTQSGHDYLLTPKAGLNMGALNQEKLGVARPMVLKAELGEIK